MKRYPLSIYLLPLVILLLVVAAIRGSGAYKKAGKEDLQKPGNPVIDKYSPPNPNEIEQDKSEKVPFESRMPVYPGAVKVALQENAKITEAVFYVTTDPIDKVKDWYVQTLGGLGKVNLIDVTSKKDGLRVVTVSLPDPPKELVEIKERFKGAKDLLITITTVGFYTKNQPRPLEPSPDDEKSTGKPGEKSEKGNPSSGEKK